MLRQRSGQSGFSAIELLVVVAVILIIAAIAVPRMMHARIKANEAAAVANMKAVETAQNIYIHMFPQTGYADTLTNLGSNGSNCETVTPTNACLIDSNLSNGLKGSYLFYLSGDGKVPDQSYTLTAIPQSTSAGECSFTSNQTGVITSTLSGGDAGGTKTAGGGTGGGGGC